MCVIYQSTTVFPLFQILLVGTGKIKESRPQDVDWAQSGHRTIKFLPHLADVSAKSIPARLKTYDIDNINAEGQNACYCNRLSVSEVYCG